MKEIRMRVWDKKKKEMHELISWHNPRYLDSVEYATGQSSGDVHSLRQDKNCVIMLFTGIKDKCGNDIFEGDIIELFCGCIGQVKFEYGEFNCYMSTDELSKHFICQKKDSPKASWKWSPKVIGNIYQNKNKMRKTNVGGEHNA